MNLSPSVASAAAHCRYVVLPSFCYAVLSLAEEERVGCFTVIVFLLGVMWLLMFCVSSSVCHRLAAVYASGSAWSCSLTFVSSAFYSAYVLRTLCTNDS